ncbi:MAG: putative Histidine kinase [Candidatus Saccharibacteria bacterium]|nr:putative Histidine kinase [Candidatus Saccharibacteria bacterium]
MNPAHPYHFDKHTLRLTISYLAVIMLMSIGFSVVFYNTSWHELGRQLPPQSYMDLHGVSGVRDHFFENRIAEGRGILLNRLIIVNLVTLIAGAFLSYFLARRSLEPIEESIEAQSRFTSDASHELRTPLTAIQARNEVALRKPKLSVQEAKEVIRSNLDEAKKLSRLSEGLLQLSYNDSHNLSIAPVSLNEAAMEAINTVLDTARAKGISIDDKAPNIKVLADKQNLSQAISILLDNAIKYSPEGSVIEIGGYARGKQAYLTVKDKGDGIKASDLPHIFQRFYRTEASRTKKGSNGYGLGLSIADKIITQHGGEITVKSQPGKGSTFTIRLPGA